MKKLRALASDLNLPNLDATTVQAQMQRLCQSLDEVSISTIDALFSRLLSGYRHELGIADGVRMETLDSPEMLRLAPGSRRRPAGRRLRRAGRRTSRHARGG